MASEIAASQSGGEMGLLQDTVDQFEKVIEMERTVLRKSIAKHERDLEEVSTELAMKEEELAVWEERVQQIQKDNEIKFCLAKARFDTAKWRGKGKTTSSVGATALGFIAEGDEPDCFAEGDEDEDDEEDAELLRKESFDQSGFLRDDDADANPAKREGTSPIDSESPAGAVEKQPHPGAEAANALADIVVGELAMLKRQWQDLVDGVDSLTGVGSPIATPSRGGAPASQVMGQILDNFVSRGQTGRMTVEERIDRLQRDIRTETDRILQERGASSANRRNSGASVSGASVSGTVSAPTSASSTPVMASTGSKVLASGTLGSSQGRVELIPQTVSGLHAPAQARLGPGASDSNSRLASKSGGTPLRPTNDIQDSPSPMAGSPVMPAKGLGTASAQAAGFPSVGSLIRCVSPSAMQTAQVGRARPQQLIAGRPLASMSPTVRSVDPLQGSVSSMSSSASGAQRWAQQTSNPYSAQVQAPQPGGGSTIASSGTAPSPPPPAVIGTSGLSLGSRGSAPIRATPSQHAGATWR